MVQCGEWTQTKMVGKWLMGGLLNRAWKMMGKFPADWKPMILYRIGLLKTHRNIVICVSYTSIIVIGTNLANELGPHQECPVGQNRGPGAGIPSIIIYLLLTSINSLYHCWYTPMKNHLPLYISSISSTLWWTNIAMENGHWNSGFTHKQLCFSIAMLVHQRVYPIKSH